MGLLTKISDNRNPDSLAVRLRRKRFALFSALIADLPQPVRIVDVGGTEEFWCSMGLAGEPAVEITVLNLYPLECRAPNISSQVADARDLHGRFEDGSFDVAFSNSVIEHLSDPGDQRKMAEELRRLAPRYFVQTPNYYFPLEPHFLVPGFQWMPEALQILLLQRFRLGWAERAQDPAEARRTARSVRLLTEREFRALFPGCRIFRERVLGLTKSFIAYGGFDLAGRDELASERV